MNVIELVRQTIRKLIGRQARLLHRASRGTITANHVTWVSLVLHLPIALAIVSRQYELAALLLALFGLLDTLDGQLARLQETASNYGVFLDSTTDRIKEALVYLPLVFVFADEARPVATLIAGVALAGALITSYARARGEAVIKHTATSAADANQIFKDGFARYEIRMTIMVVGLAVGKPDIAVTSIALSAWLTIIFRMIRVLRALA